VEALVILLICGSVALGWREIRRPESGAASHWVAGWMAAGAGSMLLIVQREFPLAHYLAYPLGTLFPALLLAGGFAFARRPVPRALLPVALGFGALRVALAATGHPHLAWASALSVEPAAVLATAWLVWRATPERGVSLSQRLLGPSLLLLAAAGIVHVVWMMRVEVAGAVTEVPPGLLAMWVVTVPLLFGIQLHAEWERSLRALQRAREQLEQRVAERTAALRESEARYRVASELSSDLTFGLRVDPDDNLREGWVSNTFGRMVGYTLDELKGGSWLAAVHPDDLERTRAQLAAIFAGHTRDLETRLVTKAGESITVQARLRITREDDGTLLVVGAASDVTDARRAEQERRRLEQHVFEAQRLESLAVLTGGVAHDFNNLLAVILGNSRMALADAAPESPLYTRLARIRAAADHGARLTAQMLAYSGRSSFERKPLDLSRLLEEMADLLRASLSERCQLVLELSSRAPVEGDATQLQQVVLNLATNASEALGEREGCVWVRAGTTVQDAASLAGAVGTENPVPGAYTFLEVADDGPGMDAATQARVFEPFFTTKFSGRGLGLAAVLGIVRAHGGVVLVRSEPGRGTSIRVLLPEPGSVLARSQPTVAAGEPAPRRATVLVVDDQDFVLEVAQAFLERAGHRVLTAIGGRAGIERFREHAHEIDAVLLDLAMPDADGEAVLRELQRLRPDVRVIIATGYGSGHAAERLASAHVAGILRKPYEAEEMVALVQRVLAQPD
jgi:PAS domain S-box-containing protein